MQNRNRRGDFSSPNETSDSSSYGAYSAHETKRIARQEAQKQRRKKILNATYIFVSIVCLAILSLCVIFLFPQLSGKVWHGMDSYAFVSGNIVKYDENKIKKVRQMNEYMLTDTIFPGVYIDDIHMGGKTIDEARAILQDTNSGKKKEFSVEVEIGDKTWTIDSNNVPITRNIGNVLEQAYAYGRQNSAAISGTKYSPVAERFNQVIKYRTEGKSLYTDWTYDKNAVRSLVNSIAAYIQRDPIDSDIAEFDFNTREFKFTDDEPGCSIDANKLYDTVIASIDKWEKGAKVTTDVQIIPAKARKLDMINNFKMIAAYTTKTSGSSDRINNIKLACQSINGHVLYPDETFSFNETVGQRTIEEGYKSAGTIAKGQLIQDVGGGICQVSTTLFNAAVRADLQVVKRNNHAWPISYITIGEDAAVNWPNLDLKLKNNKKTPVFIIMYYDNKKTSAEIYGMSLGDGISIDLDSTIKKELVPPKDPEYVLNPNLSVGEQKQVVKPRIGYVVDTYKIWYENGNELRREKLHTTTYKAYQEKIEYNDGSGL